MSLEKMAKAIEQDPPLTDEALNDLFRAAWPGHQDRGFQKVLEKSLLYLAAKQGGKLIGFVNVAWDGGKHGFVLDTTVHPEHQGQGLGSALLQAAVAAAKKAGLEWLHVDFESGYEAFYRKAGFKPTVAGLIHLQ